MAKYELQAQRLRQALNNKNMTAQELSNRSGIAKSSISGYMNGNHCPTNKAAYAIGQVLEVSPQWLMGFDEPSQNTDAYYIDSDAKEIVEFLFNNPEYKILFSACRKVDKNDINFVKDFIDRIKKD